MRIAILGGSFDPIHNGHLQMAKYALKHLPIDEVWFVPTKLTPLKDRTLTSFKQRCDMVKIAISPFRHMRVCTIEKDLGDTSYSIDTICCLKKRYPKYKFIWLIGSDQAVQLDKWKDINSLMELVPFYVFLRNEDTLSCDYQIHKVHMPLIHISSTDIREGKKLQMLPKGVRDYIGRNYLYFETMISSFMNEHRYKHSLSVAALCEDLAIAHKLNPIKAYACGLLHDVCKQWPFETSRIWMENLDSSFLPLHKNIWHAYTASRFIRRYFHVYDREICFAIRNHVTGTKSNQLAMILYVADKLDPTRGYDSQSTIKLCMNNLEAGYDEVYHQQQEYLKKENVNE